MKRILITGGTGFVGANLTRQFLREGHEIHLLVRPHYTPWRIEALLNEIRLHPADLDDIESLERIVSKIRPQWIFHAAAFGSSSWQTDLRQISHVNILGTLNLLEACLKTDFEIFVNTGTSSEYGFKDHAPPETERLEPNSPYAAAKATATLLCRTIGQSRRAPIVTLRLYSAYGPYEDPKRLIPTLILRGLKGELPPLVNPTNVHDYIYINDVVEAYRGVVRQPQWEPGAVYNVGTSVQTTLREVVDVARRVLKITAEPRWGTMPDRRWDSNVWVSNSEKIKKALGWQPRTPFEEGFKQTVNWFQENPALRNLYASRI